MQTLQKFFVPPHIPTLFGFLNCLDVDIYNISFRFIQQILGNFTLFCEFFWKVNGGGPLHIGPKLAYYIVLVLQDILYKWWQNQKYTKREKKEQH